MDNQPKSNPNQMVGVGAAADSDIDRSSQAQVHTGENPDPHTARNPRRDGEKPRRSIEEPRGGSAGTPPVMPEHHDFAGEEGLSENDVRKRNEAA